MHQSSNRTGFSLYHHTTDNAIFIGINGYNSSHFLLRPWSRFIHQQHNIIGLKIWLTLNHFCQDIIVCKYSLDHLIQNWSIEYSTCRHHLFAKQSSGFWHWGEAVTKETISTSDSVTGSWLSGSSVTGVRGWAFKIAWTSSRKVWSWSSERTLSPVTDVKIRHTDLIWHSHTPPMWLAPGRLKLWRVSFWRRNSSTWCWFLFGFMEDVLFTNKIWPIVWIKMQHCVTPTQKTSQYIKKWVGR